MYHVFVQRIGDFTTPGGGGYSHTLPIRVFAAQGVVILKLLI